MSVQIYTITHIPFTPPADPIYIPLQVGRALHDGYGYPGDDTGDNISTKNPYYSELTGLYWIWKNVSDADILGLCHYRRFFLNREGTLMSEADYRHILSDYDVIIATPERGDYDYRTIYARSHDIRHLEQTGEVIHRLYPDYYEAFQTVTAGRLCYVGNLFAAPREIFFSYCEWLFSIFSVLEKELDLSGCDDYQKRVFGFLSEQLLAVWIGHNHLSCYEAPYSIDQEKAETVLLKENLQGYLTNADVHGAYECLCSTLEKRPDLLLQLSDFDRELETTEHILNVCRIEEEAGLPTLLSFSRNLNVLIKHFRLLIKILERIQEGVVSREEVQYLIDCRVSPKALIYIIQNFSPLAAAPLELLNQLAVIYDKAGGYLTALSFLEEALPLQENNHTTLSHIISVFRHMGHPEMAVEYELLLEHASPKRIVVFTGSPIPILNYIAEQYINAFTALGHIVFRFDKQNFEKSFASLRTFQKQGIHCVIVFNNTCFPMRLQSGKSLWDLWHVPCCNIIVDHPMYYHDTMDDAPALGTVACADRCHADYIRRFCPAVRRTIFLPTAGECLKPYEALKSFAGRPISVLFIGTYKYAGRESYDAFSTQLEAYLMQHPENTFESAVEHCLLINHQILSDDALKEWIQEHRFVDVNVSAIFRTKILKALIDAGITVTVYGTEFEHSPLYGHPCFDYRGPCSTEEGIRLMEESKIVLNQLSWFKAGASERIFEAMLQGAVALTDESSYLKECFTDGEDIAFYSLSQLDKLPDLVHSLLTDEPLAEKIRKNAYEKACMEHTWFHRASALLNDLTGEL